MSTFGRVRAMALVGTFLLGIGSGACASDDDAYPVRLELGEQLALCSTGAILCPVGTISCDDPSIVSIGSDPRGPLLSGARVGTTLCSAGTAGGAGMRRVFRVTVIPKRAP